MSMNKTVKKKKSNSIIKYVKIDPNWKWHFRCVIIVAWVCHKSWNLTFFESEISEPFFILGAQEYHMKIRPAHHPWFKQVKNIWKTRKNGWFVAPYFISRQTCLPVFMSMILYVCYLHITQYLHITLQNYELV